MRRLIWICLFLLLPVTARAQVIVATDGVGVVAPDGDGYLVVGWANDFAGKAITDYRLTIDLGPSGLQHSLVWVTPYFRNDVNPSIWAAWPVSPHVAFYAPLLGWSTLPNAILKFYFCVRIAWDPTWYCSPPRTVVKASWPDCPTCYHNE